MQVALLCAHRPQSQSGPYIASFASGEVELARRVRAMPCTDGHAGTHDQHYIMSCCLQLRMGCGRSCQGPAAGPRVMLCLVLVCDPLCDYVCGDMPVPMRVQSVCTADVSWFVAGL